MDFILNGILDRGTDLCQIQWLGPVLDGMNQDYRLGPESQIKNFDHFNHLICKYSRPNPDQ